jgi:hypothetical protein
LLSANFTAVRALGSFNTRKISSTVSVQYKVKMDLVVNNKQELSILYKALFDNIDIDSNLYISIFQNPIYYFTFNNSLVLIEDQNRAVLRFAAYLRS